MKIIFLRKNEKKVLTQVLYELVRQPGCSYELTTILEKLDYSKYEKAFDIMNVNKESFPVDASERFFSERSK